MNKFFNTRVNKFLIVSLGSIGIRHLQNLRTLRPDSEIGILRLSTQRVDEIHPEGIVQFFDIEEALSFSPCAVFICSPATLHLKIASIFVENSIPVFIEKPFADKSDGLEALIANAELKKIPLMIGYSLRFLPSLIEVRRLIYSGAIGEILGLRAEVGQYLPEWRTKISYQASVSARKELGGGAILELSHEIDYVYWLFGMPTWVSATCGKYSDLDINVEDMASICFEYSNPKRLASIHVDFVQRSASRICKFIGASGTLIWNGIEDSIALYQAESDKWLSINVPEKADKNIMYLREISHFLDCIETQVNPSIDGLQGFDVLRIIEAAKKSAALRVAVRV